MKIYDMHIHSWDESSDTAQMLSQMKTAGVYGGCVFSMPPAEFDGKTEKSFDERLEDVMRWSVPERLFPVMWIHPYEKDIEKKIYKAVDAGISAFKIICSNFYVYEDKPLQLLSQIAETGKPVIFHSGILWDGGDSSMHNRPVFWESLINIKNLRFSMGHCSWPWHDECIALYGKFLNSVAQNDTAPEMFFDITPGTPPIYRHELLEKLMTVGYDVPDNIMFGTDSSAGSYNSSGWVSEWLDRDGKILDSLGIGDGVKEKIYHDNVLRFLGLTPKNFTHLSPTTDNAHRMDINNIKR